MKILFFNPSGLLGGGERALLDLMISMRARVPTANIHLLICESGPFAELAAKCDFSVSVLPMPKTLANFGDSQLNLAAMNSERKKSRWLLSLVGASLASVPYLLRLRSVLLSMSPDLIHSNGLKCHLLAAIAKPHFSVLIWHVRDMIGQRSVISKLLRLVEKRVSGIIAISQAVRKDFERVSNNIPAVVVYDGIDLRRFNTSDKKRSFNSDRLDQMNSPFEDCIRIGIVATFARWKGQDLFLEAVAIFKSLRADLNVKFYIVGGAIYKTTGSQFTEDELKKLAEKLLCLRDITFTGFIEDITQVYKYLDIVVHASTKPEPFGLTIVEAMASGKAVIAANAGGAAEIFQNDYDALGVPPSNACALAAAMIRLAEDKVLRERLGKAGQATAIARFSRDRLGAEMFAAYQAFNIASKE